MFYVEHVGHRWATQAVSFATEMRAMDHARRSCSEAMNTRVYDCTKGPIGVLVAEFNRRGERI